MGFKVRDIIFRGNVKGAGKYPTEGGLTKYGWTRIRDLVVVKPNRVPYEHKERVFLCGISRHTGRVLSPSIGMTPEDLDDFCADWLKSRGLIEEV